MNMIQHEYKNDLHILLWKNHALSARNNCTLCKNSKYSCHLGYIQLVTTFHMKAYLKFEITLIIIHFQIKLSSMKKTKGIKYRS